MTFWRGIPRNTGPRALPRFAALAVACFACTPASAPPPSARPPLERSPSASASPVLDAAAPQGRAAELPGDASAAPAPVAYDPFDPWPSPAAHTAESDAGALALRGSAADVHTTEGAARGYRVHRQCPSYSQYDVVAVVGTGAKGIPQFGPASPSFGKRPLAEIEKEFWAFVSEARRVAAVSSIHSVGAAGPCFGPSNEDAVILYLHDWREVDQAIRNVGAWLAAHDWNGDVILWLQPVPGRTYSK